MFRRIKTRKSIDLINKKFVKLTVVAQNGRSKSGDILWLCKCECGKKTSVTSNNLTSGSTKSCGCLNKEQHFKHGHSRRGKESKTHRAWWDMLQRCNNKKHISYKNYGGRGITVCKRWLNKNNGFINFLKDMGEIPKELTLDRINNDILINGYSPKNCKLSTRKEQARNRRNNKKYKFDGEAWCLNALASKYNINKNTLRYRLNMLGWSIKRALTTPLKRRRNKNAN